MNRSFVAPLLSSLAWLCVSAQAAPAVETGVAPAPAPAGRAAAVAACERAAQDTLRDARGASASASFGSAPALVPGASDASEITLRGSGLMRTANGTRRFGYSCTFDTRANTVAGMVLRDAAAPERLPSARAVEPDLSQLSPAACESAAAGALKRRWPGVAHINFNADTRQLSQLDGGPANLRGQGSATPSVREPSTHFSYDCTVDPRSGRIVAVRIAD